jgi:hypothetical protein
MVKLERLNAFVVTTNDAATSVYRHQFSLYPFAVLNHISYTAFQAAETLIRTPSNSLELCCAMRGTKANDSGRFTLQHGGESTMNT